MLATIALWTLAAVLVVTGLVGLLLPALPGSPLLFAGLLLAAWMENFDHVGPGILTVLGLMVVLTYVVDFGAGALGARQFGASRSAVIGAAIGAVVGIFFGLPGILLGPFVGAVIGELAAARELREAGVAGVGASVGLLLGTALKMALGFAMLAIFLVARFL